MKLVSIAMLLMSTSSFAVIVSKCPQTLSFDIPEVSIFSKGFVENQTRHYDYSRVDFNSIDNFQARMFTSFAFEGVLVNTKNSTCTYESVERVPDFREVKIAGTDKKARLVMNFEDYRSETALTFYASPTEKSPQYKFSGATAQIKADAWGESWGDSYLVNISVGKGTIR